ncbi:MAG: histidine kinase [Saonia sp.]
MFKKATLKKFGFRLLVVNVIFFLVKLTINHGDVEESFWDSAGIFYYCTAFFLIMFTWEINDWLIGKQLKSGEGLNISGSAKIIGWSLVFIIPVSALVYYLGIYEFNHLCKIDADDPDLRFRIDVLRAILLGSSIVLFNLFYHSVKQRKDLEQEMNQLQKEVMTSKYKSLKSQISPHFLFNSLNTLTSLMYEDRDLASDFVSRLASSYRYILDNREEDLVSLEKELSFLDSFIFMMNVRHQGSLRINTDIGVDAEQFLIPTLSLQMLVENALKHNYYSRERPMDIRIFTVGKIGIVVQNTLQKREQQEESTKLGIKNIKKRYSFYTNQEVSVEAEKGYFKVTMPLLRNHPKDVNVLSVS